MRILIIGFTNVLRQSISCLCQSVTTVITKCDGVFYNKARQRFYYKVRQMLLQSAMGITKCDDHYKGRLLEHRTRFLLP